MLLGLSIRDVVLIDRVDLSFRRGLGVLTGETGAGKSILLDALGLALGARGETALVRHGADRAIVTAEFAVSPDHPVHALLADQGIDEPDGPVLRRVMGADGRSRAFINDQPVSVTLLREVGESLVEIQGQHAARGLLETATHRAALDDHGALGDMLAETADAHRAWRAAAEAEREAAAELEAARTEEEYLRHSLTELDALDPQADEEAALVEKRALLKNREQITEGMTAAHRELVGQSGAEESLRAAIAAIGRVEDKAGGALSAVVDELERAIEAATEAAAALEAAGQDMDQGEERLERVEDRLYALRDVARKHRCGVPDLPGLREGIAAKLARIATGDEIFRESAAHTEAARGRYLAAARKLGQARRDAARRLDAAVAAELPPLKLDKASFRTVLTPLEESDWGEHGLERVAFEVSTNPGAPFGPIGRIASGGELARFMLALKVTLSSTGEAATLVFDEVDSGIGGAVADAVGERLHRLGQELQVLVVTHSPQVAARGSHHWRVAKVEKDAATLTGVTALDAAERREEIARMLSGARVTDEARAAADSLMAGAGP
jgi:DNA repair protein RecN (Recombination protein N)